MSGMGVVLALDLGTVRVGVAVSDALGWLAQPLVTIPAEGDRALARTVAELVSTHHASRVVVGLPVRMNGEEGPEAAHARVFAGALARRAKVPVELWDERLTTAASERRLIERGLRRERRVQVRDQLAAALFLQDYLDVHRTR